MKKVTEHLPTPREEFINVYELPVSEKKAYQKEPATLAIHRMLGYADQMPGRFVTAVRSPDGSLSLHPHKPRLGGSRNTIGGARAIAALTYLAGHELSGKTKLCDNAMSDVALKANAAFQGKVHGVGILAMDPEGCEFALQRKDALHPAPYFAGRLALMGGMIDMVEASLFSGDDLAVAAALRELYEEVTDVEVASEIAHSMAYAGPTETACYLIARNGWPYTFVLHMFVARADDAAQWAQWKKVLGNPEGLGEATPAILDRTALRNALVQERAAAHERRVLLELHGDAVAHSTRGTFDAYSRTKTQSVDEWLAKRQSGSIPLSDRGNFPFIAGQGAAIRAALHAADIHL